MSTDLKYLGLTAILTASLWIPYVVCQVMTNGGLKPPNYLDPTQRPIPLWGRRADRAYVNAVETFAPFAALVIAVHLAGNDPGVVVSKFSAKMVVVTGVPVFCVKRSVPVP